MKKKLFASTVGALFLLSSISFAQQDDQQNTVIVITASRAAETVDETLSLVTIIDQQAIDKSGATSVGEVLNTVPGVNISNSGGAGKVTSVFLRGAESDQVLVLIDGIKISSATSGTASFENIPLALIEKIEVVRGPRSSLYGSEAIGGVIQIFTKSGGEDAGSSIRLSTGSYKTQNIDAVFSGGSENSWYSSAVSSYRTDGINACTGSFTAGCFTFEPDNDGYENIAFSLRAGSQITDRFSLETALLNSKGESEFDGSFTNGSETLTRSGHIKSTFLITDSWNTSLKIGQVKDESENFLRKVSRSRFNTKRSQVNWLNEVLFSQGRILAGVDYTRETISSTASYVRTGRENTGVFITYSTLFATNSNIELSLRNDDNDQFGDYITGGIAYGYTLDNDVQFVASYGTAFKAPNFNELYFPSFGNPNLLPEISNSIDLGLRGKTETIRWSLNLYRNNIERLIGTDANFFPVNIGKAEITGIEFETGYNLGEWLVQIGLSIQDPKNAGGGVNHAKQLPRRAKYNYNLDVSREIGRWDIGGSFVTVGKSYDDSANTRLLKSYNLVNLRGFRPIFGEWKLGIHLNNIFDTKYETASFYSQKGFNGDIVLHYEF